MSYQIVSNQVMKMRSLFLLVILCVGFPAHAIDEERLKTFLADNDYWNVRLSPDGKHISLLTVRDDRNTLVVLDLETMQPTVSVKYEEDKKIEITNAEWISNEVVRYSTSRKVARLEQQFGQPSIFLLSVDGSSNERIWSYKGNYENQARSTGKLVRGFPSVISRLEDDDNKLLLHVRPFSRDGADRGGIYSLELDSGDVRQISKVPEYTQEVVSNDDGTQFVATTLDREYDRGVYVSGKAGAWQPIVLGLSGFAKDFSPFKLVGDYIYATAQGSSEIDAPTHIIRYRMSTGDWEDVFEIGFASLSDIDIADDGTLTRVQYVDGKPVVSVLDASDRISQVVTYFAKSYEGFNISVISVTDDKSKILLHVGSGAHAGEYFLFDFDTRKARFLVAMREAIDGNELNPLQDATYTASDGLTIPGWFQAPGGVEKPALIVDIHGGPHGPYQSFGFNPGWHLFNEMGYAVYAPNFRGSGGYGPNFEHSGYGEWGSRMIDDMYEGVQALIAEGRVDPERVCVYGGSYGGYATAQSLVRFNDFYRCGVIIAGFFDAKTLMTKSDIHDSYFGDNYMSLVIGDNEEQLRELSPIYHIDKIKAPMLVLHGEEDERTPFKGAEEFVDALKAAGKDFDYQWYKKEGHGNRKLENRIDEWQRIEAFLKENL